MAKQTAGQNTPRRRETTKKDSAQREATGRQKSNSYDWAAALDRWINDHRSALALGSLLMLIGVGLLIAFISYLFNGVADQSVVGSALDEPVRESGREARNWLGVVGASIAHVFVFRWFGVGALGLPLIVFLSGWKVCFGRDLLPLARTTQGIIFFTIWTSLIIGYIVLSTDTVSVGSVWCGGIGYELNILLRGLLGWGSIAFIGFVLFVFVLFYFNVSSLDWNFNWIPKSSVDDEADFEDDTFQSYKDESIDNQPIVVNIPKVRPVPETPAPAADIEDISETTAQLASLNGTKTNGHAKEPPAKEPTLGTTLIIKPQPPVDENLIEPVEPVKPAFDVPVGEADDADLVAKHGLYDPTLDLPQYKYPTFDLLTEYQSRRAQVSETELEENKNKIEDTLLKFGIGIKKIFAEVGPTVTLYEIIPADGVRISKIKNLEDDIALNLAALGIRIIAPMPGKGTIGIEVPNKNREMVSIRSVITSEKFTKCNYELPVVLGKTISNEIYIADLAKMPHLLMAGATGQGKSVGLNVLLTSLIYKKHPAHLKFVLVDPKKVELTLFNKLERHFLAKLPDSEEAIITDTKKVVNTLNSLCIEMDNRYNLLKEAGVRNIKEYNAKFTHRKLSPERGHRFLPYIVLIIDELADLMMTAGKEVEQPIARLAQLARAIGIHLVVATQRPSVNVITGLIKANFPARLSFKVTSKIDSRTILDAGGAEQLVGMGDMLLSSNSDIIRLQCPFVDTDEIEELCDFVGAQRGYDDAYALPEFVGDDGGNDLDEKDVDLENRDSMFDEAARLIVIHQQGSTSLIQRRLKLGYNRAGRLIDQLEAAGIVGSFEGSKARDVLIQDAQQLEELLRKLKE